jgi:hypothetical protein
VKYTGQFIFGTTPTADVEDSILWVYPLEEKYYYLYEPVG